MTIMGLWVPALLTTVIWIAGVSGDNSTSIPTSLTIIKIVEDGTNNNATDALEFLQKYNIEAGQSFNLVVLKEWDVDTNITDYNEEESIKQQLIAAKFDKDMRNIAATFNTSTMSWDTQRQLGMIQNIGTSAQPNETKVAELSQVMADMESIYGTAKVCLKQNQCLTLEPDITRLMVSSRDYDLLATLWTGWRNETGRKMKNLFTNYVKLSNEAVQFLGFQDAGEEWRSGYESDTFIDDVRDLFDQVAPLYEQLHAYVRRRLRQVYGESRFPKSGHIPAHILGDLWAEQWDSLIDLVKPFSNKTAMDVTPEMIKQNYTVDQIFRTAEKFFVSLGFEEMVPTFWNRSMLVKPTDGREVVCHASAWDFYDQKDFRIKMCTDITQQDLMTVHHEMGHIAYFMQYRDQPVIYRDGANDGFHEAVGDVMALSVQTPEHMKKLNLIPEIPTDEETDINFLMNMALQKIAFLPFGYLIDQWRWSVFSGKTSPDRYNQDWWDLRCHLQGVSPPVPRSEDDFDPGAKFHVAAGVPYLRYFISFIIQFQFHQAACDAAGYTGPLHRCDIYNNTAAGEKLREMLKRGSSIPWTEAMKLLTGQDKMSAFPLMEYFKPLLIFLRKENGNDYGWDPHCPNLKDNGNQGTDTTCTKSGAGDKVHVTLLVVPVLFLIYLF
uniref:Angiotensin-converting enzyme n=1 Tax=Arion vulgaris TaxID=1028688 RepID=A0A0B7ANC9_9EUPU